MLSGERSTSADGSKSNQNKMPQNTGEVVFFDSINGPQEYSRVVAWLNGTLVQTLTDLQKLTTTEERTAYLEKSIRLKAFTTGTEQGPASKPYGLWFRELKTFLDQFMSANASAVSDVAAAWKSRFQFKFGFGNHDTVPKEAIGDALKKP
jgi:hypothetical protein